MMRRSKTSSWHIDAAAGAVHPIKPPTGTAYRVHAELYARGLARDPALSFSSRLRGGSYRAKEFRLRGRFELLLHI